MQGFTYAQLIAALQSWPVVQSGPYVADLPRIVGLGELRLVKDLNLSLFDLTDDDVVIVSGDREVAKPDGLLALRSFRAVDQTTGVSFPLQQRSLDYCLNYAPNSTVTGVPKYIADLDEATWLVVPTPDDDYDTSSTRIQRPDGLSVSNTNTWLGDNVGDVLFVACLMEAEHYLKADDRYGDMKSKYYEELLPIARLELRNHVRTGDYAPLLPAAKTAE